MSRKKYGTALLGIALLVSGCAAPTTVSPQAGTATIAPNPSTDAPVDPTESVQGTGSWNATSTPDPNPPADPATETAEPAEAGPPSMAFVADVTLPDGTVVQPGELLLKIWRVENNGGAAWETEWPPFLLTFDAGDQLSGPSTAQALFYPPGVELSLESDFMVWSDPYISLEPGEQADLPLLLRAPEAAGHYRGYWMLVSGEGEELGGLYVDIIVEEDAAPSDTWSGAWTQQDPYITSSCYGPLNLLQEGSRVDGFGYACDGRLLLARGSVTDPGVVEGSFGLGGFVFPFTWVMLPGGNQFQGIYQDSSFTVGAWCAGRYGEEPPFEACMPVE